MCVMMICKSIGDNVRYLSNAICPYNGHPSSSILVKFKCVKHDLAFRHPCWYLKRKSMICSVIIISNNLQITDVNLSEQ